MSFNISVIIPVYNCEQFVEKAISSALMQPQVCEVVVVNDGSTDASETIITQLQTQHPKIKLYHHPNKINKGRSATRNLGIQNAIGNYIAFLDADDFYLENRFKNDQLIFENNPKAHGVYNAIGVHFYREASKTEKQQLTLFTVNKPINPDALFSTLLSGKSGHFSIDGLTVKREVFDMVGYFNESLIVAEDTELIFKMSLKCILVSGNIKYPVAIRGVHDLNVFNQEKIYEENKLKFYESLLFWCCKKQISSKKIDAILNWIWILKYKQQSNLISHIGYWFKLFSKCYRLFFSMLSIKYFPIIRLRQKLFPFLFKHKVLSK